jgi:Protein of unknown function (DUF3604)
MRTFLALMALCLVAACNKETAVEEPVSTTATDSAAATTEPAIERNPERNAYFGDLHVHTMYSFDAYLFGTRTSPDDAYAFAKGETIKHASGSDMKISTPLDFEAVTDHGTYLGMVPAMFDPASTVFSHPVAARLREAIKARDRTAFREMLPYIGGQVENDDLLDKHIVRNTWQDVVASAERNNEPGKFTAFIGYEYTASGPQFENLHRNVIFQGSAHPDMPFTRLDSGNPEDLWNWMDDLRKQNIEALAIPHNSNGSNGWMFQDTTYGGEPIDDLYAAQRMRNEPLVEVTQVKGTSETHPLLSPNDEWANFEIMPTRVASDLASQAPGSYVRDAYLRGLVMESTKGFNPYRFGLIGSSDTHNSAGSFDENNYWSKTGVLDITPQQRGSVPLDKPGADGKAYASPAAQYWGASGLAGVWADANTRDDLYAAMRRKETFGTSGTHIKVRFFAGHDLPGDMATRTDAIKQAYEHGVAMGSDLLAGNNTAEDPGAPSFFAWASRDANSRPLQRLQIIKGWVEDGSAQETIFDIACARGAVVDPTTQRCPDNGAKVDLTTCATNDETGAAELKTLWTDPEFDADQRAFYYVRVLENPTCRWSTWDAIRAGVTPRPDMQATIQDRAWSSPIWYVPIKAG